MLNFNWIACNRLIWTIVGRTCMNFMLISFLNYNHLIDYIQGFLKATVHHNTNLNNLSYSSVTPYQFGPVRIRLYIFFIVERIFIILLGKNTILTVVKSSSCVRMKITSTNIAWLNIFYYYIPKNHFKVIY